MVEIPKYPKAQSAACSKKLFTKLLMVLTPKHGYLRLYIGIKINSLTIDQHLHIVFKDLTQNKWQQPSTTSCHKLNQNVKVA